MQDAECLLYTAGVLDNYQSKKPILDISNVTVQNGEQQSTFAWGTLLKKARECIIQGRRDEAMKAKTTTVNSIANNISSDKEQVLVIDKSYLDQSFEPPTPKVKLLIEETIEKFTLNSEQARAFSIVANHASKQCNDQLKMYLEGMAGIGKSQVIKVLMYYFVQ